MNHACTLLSLPSMHCSLLSKEASRKGRENALPLLLNFLDIYIQYPDHQMADMEVSPEQWDVWVKVAAFLVVQVLVYLILTKSSNIFSSSPTRSLSFQRMPSASVRQLWARFSDLPAAAEEVSTPFSDCRKLD